MKRYTRKTINYYNKIAGDYFRSSAAIVIKNKIDQFISSLSGKKVLDVGCGPGHDTNYLRKKGIDCTGIDLSERMIEIARQNFGEKFEIMDFFNLKFKNDYFDGLWCSSVFVHVARNDLNKILGNFRKVLKNNGSLGIITVQKQKVIKNKNDTRAYIMYGKKELEDYLRRNGYKILVSETFIYGGKKRLFIIAKNKK